MPITNAAQLRSHVEDAIRIEFSTIPPYLFAMYSIEDQGSEATRLIRSIAAEEMLHGALVANLLVALGGDPEFGTYIPTYPSLLPNHIPPLELHLAPCSLPLLRDVFMRIEQPEVHDAPAQPDQYETLGQFYHALERAIVELSAADGLFTDPQAERQLSDQSFYTPVEFDAAESGGLELITDVATAQDAIEVIVHQGEGLSADRWADPAHHELTHYHKLKQIVDGGTELGAVRPIGLDPRLADFPTDIRAAAELFNAAYRYLYVVLDMAYSGRGDQANAVAQLYTLMSNVMAVLGRHLVRQPLGNGLFAAPTFELHRFTAVDPREELAAMASAVVAVTPELEGVAQALDAL